MVTQQDERSQRDGTGRRAVPPPARPHRLADNVYRTLLGRLVSNGIEPGSRITVDGISRELSVSQTPVREALTRLEADGLVTKIHLIGYRATLPLDRHRFDDLFAMRLLLEPAAAAGSASRRTEEVCVALRASAATMSEMTSDVKLSNYGAFALEDARFHDLIASSCGNELLRETLTRLHAHVHLFRLHYHAVVPIAAISEHEVILDAIAARAPRAASAAMRRHVQQSRGRLRQAFR